MEKRALALVGFAVLMLLDRVAAALCEPSLEIYEPTVNQRLAEELIRAK